MQALYKNLSTHGTTAAFVLGILGVGITLMSLFSNSARLSVSDAAKQSTAIANEGVLDTAFMITAIFLAICVIVILFYGAFHLLTDLKGSMKFLIGFIVLGLIFFAAYSMAETETSVTMTRLMERFNVTDGQSKFISGSIVTTLLLCGLAVVSFVVFELLNLFK